MTQTGIPEPTEEDLNLDISCYINAIKQDIKTLEFLLKRKQEVAKYGKIGTNKDSGTLAGSPFQPSANDCQLGDGTR